MTTAIQRARRITVWSLGCGLALGWIGAFAQVGAQVEAERLEPVRLAVALLALVAFSWYGARIVRAVLAHTHARRDIVVAGMLALAVLLVQDAQPTGWGLVAIAWLSVATLRLRPVPAALLSIGTAVACLLLYRFPTHDVVPVLSLTPRAADGLAIGLYVGLCLLLPYSTRLWVWIFDLAEQAHAGMDAQARLAVSEERLRFARDLHDLVGHSLSVIAVRTELAVKLSAVDAGRATAEMTAVQALARDSLRQIREAVRGYRVLDLPAEVESVRAILAADGVRCDVDLVTAELGPELTGTFAWVVREAATNILRHSSATQCRITLRVTDGVAVLEVLNDGAGHATDDHAGTGLTGLAERLATVGGSLTGRATGDGRFLLRAVAPAVPAAAVAA